MSNNNKEKGNFRKNSAKAEIPEGFRAIVMYGMSNQQALAVMQAVKNSGSEMHDVAFAMTTETNIDWPLHQLIFALSEEHTMMK
jgi:hypothetical protein